MTTPTTLTAASAIQPAAKAPSVDDGAAGQDERDQGDELQASRSRLDSLKIGLALEREARSIEQRLIRARPQRVAERDEQDRGQQTDDAFPEPAEHHGRGLRDRAAIRLMRCPNRSASQPWESRAP
jgi:hypothetical protein